MLLFYCIQRGVFEGVRHSTHGISLTYKYTLKSVEWKDISTKETPMLYPYVLYIDLKKVLYTYN